MANVLARDLFEVMLKSYLEVTQPYFDKDLGARLKTVRTEMSLTQRELAERLGLSQTEVSRLENGKNIAAMPKCDLFKTVLGKHFEYFLTRGNYYKYEEVKVSYNKQIRGKVVSKT